MSRRRTRRSSNDEMRGGAWFEYDKGDEDTFDFKECHDHKISSRFTTDYRFISGLFKKKGKVDVFEEMEKMHRQKFKKFAKKLTPTGDLDGVYVPLNKDTYNVYEDRNVYHKYYGKGVIEAYKGYTNGGYGYYIRFKDENLKNYVYTFASKGVQSWIKSTVLVESYPEELIFDIYLKYLSQKKPKSNQTKPLAKALRKMSLGDKDLKSIKDGEKSEEFKKEYGEMVEACMSFFSIEGFEQSSAEELIERIENLQEAELSDKEYIKEWGKTYFGIKDDKFFDDIKHKKKGGLKEYSSEFPETLEEAEEKAKEVAGDNDKIKKELIKIWHKYKPNEDEDEDEEKRGGFIGTLFGALFGLIVFVIMLPFAIIGWVFRVVVGIVLFTLTVVGGLIFGLLGMIASVFRGGNRTIKKGRNKTLRNKTRRNKTRRKKTRKRLKY